MPSRRACTRHVASDAPAVDLSALRYTRPALAPQRWHRLCSVVRVMVAKLLAVPKEHAQALVLVVDDDALMFRWTEGVLREGGIEQRRRGVMDALLREVARATPERHVQVQENQL